MKPTVTAAVLLAAALAAPAGIRTETVAYADGETAPAGFLAYDDAVKGKRPGVVVFREWWGLNDHAKDRARQLAALGTVALAADVYGGGRSRIQPRRGRRLVREVQERPPAAPPTTPGPPPAPGTV